MFTERFAAPAADEARLLQEYNNQIEELKAEMEEATRSAEYVSTAARRTTVFKCLQTGNF